MPGYISPISSNPFKIDEVNKINVNNQNSDYIELDFTFDKNNKTETLSIENLSDNDFNLIKNELKNYIEQLKINLKSKEDSKGILTSFANNIAEIFGDGNKSKEKEINKLENLLNNIENNPSEIFEIYQKITGQRNKIMQNEDKHIENNLNHLEFKAKKVKFFDKDLKKWN